MGILPEIFSDSVPLPDGSHLDVIIEEEEKAEPEDE